MTNRQIFAFQHSLLGTENLGNTSKKETENDIVQKEGEVSEKNRILYVLIKVTFHYRRGVGQN